MHLSKFKGKSIGGKKWIKGLFALGYRSNKIVKSSNPIGGELKIEFQGFTLGFESSQHTNDVAP